MLSQKGGLQEKIFAAKCSEFLLLQAKENPPKRVNFFILDLHSEDFSDYNS